jgi:hypothetical protein
VLADLANQLCDVVRHVPEGERAGRLNELVTQFGPATGLDTRLLGTAVTRAVEQVRDDVGPGHPLVRKTRVMERAHAWDTDTGHGNREAGESGSPATSTLTGNLLADTQLLDASASTAPRAAPVPGERQAALTAGVQDITNTLVGTYALNDVLRIIMETMYRAMGFTRVLLLVRDPRQNALRARFGLGPGTEELIRAGFSVPLSQGRDIFYAALGKGADVCVEDIDAPKIRDYVPAWYRGAITTRGLVLFPVRVSDRAIALIYCDAHEPATLQFSSDELNLLKTLRNQAVLAVKQKN